jgi:hypothetical protein
MSNIVQTPFEVLKRVSTPIAHASLHCQNGSTFWLLALRLFFPGLHLTTYPLLCA